MSDTQPSPAQTLHLPEGTEDLAATIIPDRAAAAHAKKGTIVNGIASAVFAAMGAVLPVFMIRNGFARRVGLSETFANLQHLDTVHINHHGTLSEALSKDVPFELNAIKPINAIRREISASATKVPLGTQLKELPVFGKVGLVTVGAVLTGFAVVHAVSAVKSWRSHLRHRDEADHTEQLVKDRVREALVAGELGR